MKKIFLISFLSLTILFSSAYARVYQDTENHWAKKSIDVVTNFNLMSAYERNSFKPDLLMKKVDFFAVINKLADLKKTYTVTFSDVSTDDKYYNDVAKAIKAGYLTPTMGKLYPEDPITREEVCEILGYMYGLKKNTEILKEFSDANEISDSAKGYVGALVKANIINGYEATKFAPKNEMTRAEIATVLGSLLNEYNRPQERVVIDSKIKFGDRNLYE
ncbi:S-layer homology domain-containing protein [uncultured Peptoniphilus sp.]|uniref:S-layer homology domain-containing protein n=1 Tax=uncultured Peptoniphilus sp. TaxID=254354 RepID=UPI0028057BB8|nr:S-layer homology domain-containing protein [uncultured Peptoniphilus sp.]